MSKLRSQGSGFFEIRPQRSGLSKIGPQGSGFSFSLADIKLVFTTCHAMDTRSVSIFPTTLGARNTLAVIKVLVYLNT